MLLLCNKNVLLYGSHYYYNQIYNSHRPTILLGLVRLINGAGKGNRTPLSCLEGRRTSRCTTPAEEWGNPGITPEKIGTLKKGEKISSFPVNIIPKNF